MQVSRSQAKRAEPVKAKGDGEAKGGRARRLIRKTPSPKDMSVERPRKRQPKRAPSAPPPSQSTHAKKPKLGHEASRNQYVVRSGKGGAGSSTLFQYREKDRKCQERAYAKAMIALNKLLVKGGYEPSR